MMYPPAVKENSTENISERLNAAFSDYAAASKEYYNAEKSCMSAAKACLSEATTFEEQKYWYEKMEQHASALQDHKNEAVVTIVGLLLLCGTLCIFR